MMVNGSWRDLDGLPHATKLSLKPRIYHPNRITAKAKIIAATYEPLRALPGSCKPGQAPNPLTPPDYTPKPNVQFPLAGSGQRKNKEIDPILQQTPERSRSEIKAQIVAEAQLENAKKLFEDKQTHKHDDLGKGTGAFPQFKEHAITAALPPPTYTPGTQPGKSRSFIVPDKPNLTDVKALARIHTQDAINVLVEVMHDTEAHANARVAAAESLLNRGWGKPDMNVQATIRRSVDQFTDEEILGILSSAGITLDAEETITDAVELGPDTEAAVSTEAGGP
jgi:hypothetical protein